MNLKREIIGLIVVLLFLSVYWSCSQNPAKEAVLEKSQLPRTASSSAGSKASPPSSQQIPSLSDEPSSSGSSSPIAHEPSDAPSSLSPKEAEYTLAEIYKHGRAAGTTEPSSTVRHPEESEEQPTDKIHSALRQPGQPGTFPGHTPMNYPRYDQKGRALVRILYQSGEEQEQAIQQMLHEEGTSAYAHLPKEGILEAYIARDHLEKWAHQAWVREIVPVTPAQSRMGSIATEADQLLKVSNIREKFRVTGQGVKVGVISSGVDHLSEAQATGDLPGDVIVLANGGWGTPDDEGTAMLEIIHDLAPGAKLYFHDGGSATRFIQAVRGFKKAECDIIVDDIGYYTEPFFEDGSVAQEVQHAVEEGIVFISAAGNDANKHAQMTWSAQHVDPQNPNIHEILFDAPALVLPSDEEAMEFEMEPGSALITYLQWNEQFGSASHDYNLSVYRASDYLKYKEGALLYGEWILFGKTQFEKMGYWIDGREIKHTEPPSSPNRPEPVSRSRNLQEGQEDPWEYVAVSHSGPEWESYLMVIEGHNNVADSDILKMFFLTPGSGRVSGIPGPAATPEGTVFGHPAVPDGWAIGAIDVNDPGLDTLQSFSSQGPCYVPFSDVVWRNKPDFVSVDGVSVTGAGGFSSPFHGTSAAAPHVAGMVALLKEADPSLTPGRVREVLAQTVTDLGDVGQDNQFGYGFIDLERALDTLLGVLTTDSTEPQIALSFKSGQKVDLKCKATANQKNWVLLEVPDIYPGLTFARPSDALASLRGRYLILFKQENTLVPESDSLYFSEMFEGEHIDFGINDFSGLGRAMITTYRGMNATDLEKIQEIALTPYGYSP